VYEDVVAIVEQACLVEIGIRQHDAQGRDVAALGGVDGDDLAAQVGVSFDLRAHDQVLAGDAGDGGDDEEIGVVILGPVEDIVEIGVDEIPDAVDELAHLRFGRLGQVQLDVQLLVAEVATFDCAVVLLGAAEAADLEGAAFAHRGAPVASMWWLFARLPRPSCGVDWARVANGGGEREEVARIRVVLRHCSYSFPSWRPLKR
jgi:hypothetical protein